VTRTKESPPASGTRSRAGAQDASGRRPSAATVRKTLIQVLATSEPVTAKTLEEEVGKLLPAAERPSVRQQLQILRDGSYVIEASDNHRRMTLSDSGRRWWTGIEALTLDVT
jgi:Fe2+ or Zn2+ uptake regulation protein